MSNYIVAKHSYDFVASFEIFNSWSNVYNLSCYISACCQKKKENPSHTLSPFQKVKVKYI